MIISAWLLWSVPCFRGKQMHQEEEGEVEKEVEGQVRVGVFDQAKFFMDRYNIT